MSERERYVMLVVEYLSYLAVPIPIHALASVVPPPSSLTNTPAFPGLEAFLQEHNSHFRVSAKEGLSYVSLTAYSRFLVLLSTLKWTDSHSEESDIVLFLAQTPGQEPIPVAALPHTSEDIWNFLESRPNLFSMNKERGSVSLSGPLNATLRCLDHGSEYVTQRPSVTTLPSVTTIDYGDVIVKYLEECDGTVFLEDVAKEVNDDVENIRYFILGHPEMFTLTEMKDRSIVTLSNNEEVVDMYKKSIVGCLKNGPLPLSELMSCCSPPSIIEDIEMFLRSYPEIFIVEEDMVRLHPKEGGKSEEKEEDAASGEWDELMMDDGEEEEGRVDGFVEEEEGEDGNDEVSDEGEIVEDGSDEEFDDFSSTSSRRAQTIVTYKQRLVECLKGKPRYSSTIQDIEDTVPFPSIIGGDLKSFISSRCHLFLLDEERGQVTLRSSEPSGSSTSVDHRWLGEDEDKFYERRLSEYLSCQPDKSATVHVLEHFFPQCDITHFVKGRLHLFRFEERHGEVTFLGGVGNDVDEAPWENVPREVLGSMNSKKLVRDATVLFLKKCSGGRSRLSSVGQSVNVPSGVGRLSTLLESYPNVFKLEGEYVSLVDGADNDESSKSQNKEDVLLRIVEFVEDNGPSVLLSAVGEAISVSSLIGMRCISLLSEYPEIFSVTETTAGPIHVTLRPGYERYVERYRH